MKKILLTLLIICTTKSFAECDITWTAENNSNYSINVSRTFSKVKVKGGWYSKFMNRSVSISRGGSTSEFDELSMGCNKKRRFKIYVYCSMNKGSAYLYFPSSSTYYAKGKTHFDFGDLGRVCAD